ncbi:hypothetical protein PMAYCL1PPCAC_03228, partial [Pristionchus mayeri]
RFQNTMSAVVGEKVKKDEGVKEDKDNSPWNDDKSQSDLVRRMDELNRKDDSIVLREKNVKELAKKVDEQWKEELWDIDWVCCPKVKIMLLKKHVKIGELKEQLFLKRMEVEKGVPLSCHRFGMIRVELLMGDIIEASTSTCDRDDVFIILRIVGEDLHEFHFRVRQGKCSCGKIKREYAERVGVPPSSLRFLYMGRHINDEDTPKCLGMKTDDYIDVYQV